MLVIPDTAVPSCPVEFTTVVDMSEAMLPKESLTVVDILDDFFSTFAVAEPMFLSMASPAFLLPLESSDSIFFSALSRSFDTLESSALISYVTCPSAI